MAGKTGVAVLIRKKGIEENPAFDELVEKLRQIGRDVIIIEADETEFPNLFSGETAKDFLAGIIKDIKALN